MSISLPILTDPNGDPIIDPTHEYSKEGYIPDWDYMDSYIRQIEGEYVRQIEGYLLATGLDDYTLTEEEKHALASVLDGGAALPSLSSEDLSQIWVKESKEFRIGDLFDTSIWTYGKNKQYKSRLHEPTDRSLCVVSGVTTNNGINYYTEDAVDESEIFNDCLTISTRGEYSGTVFIKHSLLYLLITF